MQPSCRFLPYQIDTGAGNMAADETLLESALAGVASFRLYGWREPTVSLGYFQSWQLWYEDPVLRTLPLVRRPSGGETLVHHHELTYAMALPAGHGALPWMTRLHRVIAAALASCHVTLQTAQQGTTARSHLCFLHPTPGDGLLGSAKIVGSAQRKRRGALLQHGAVLLAASPFTPQLPGIRELTGQTIDPAALAQAIEDSFRKETGWRINPGEWTGAESRRIAELEEIRYTRCEWNRKR
jgi:lipoate-protein ligase A